MMTHLFLELKLDISWSQGRRLRISPCTLLVQLIDFFHSVGLIKQPQNLFEFIVKHCIFTYIIEPHLKPHFLVNKMG